MKACPKCETINNDNASFCIKCSESLSPAPASPVNESTYNRLGTSSTGQNATPVTKEQLLEEYLSKSYSLQKEINNKLSTIKGWMTFIGVLIILDMVATFFRTVWQGYNILF